MLGPTLLVTRAAGQDVWRDNQDFEARRAALNRVGESHDANHRYRRHVAGPRLIEIERIRVVSSELTHAVSEGGTLNLRFIARSATEINKRARLLQASLRFAKSEVPDSRNAENTEELGAALKVLQSSIASLVDNPVFKSPRLVDINRSIQAAGDVEKVIQVSYHVKRICKKLASSTDR